MAITNDQEAVLNKAIRVWGDRQQINKAIEECGELIQALAKWQNREVKGPGFEGYNDMNPVIEEMADVTIMLVQLRKIFMCDKFIQTFIDAKLNRLDGYLANAERATDVSDGK